MEIADALEFLKTNHRGCLVTRKKDGSLQMTLVSPVLGADDNVIVTARDTTYKVKNIRRNPNVSLLVYGKEFNGSNYIQIDGKAQVISHPQAIDIVLDWYRKLKRKRRAAVCYAFLRSRLFGDERKSWQAIRTKTLTEGRVAIRVAVEKVGPQNRK